MIKKVFFQLHWLIGISAGMVIAIVGLTGAALSFQDEIIGALNGGVVNVTPRDEPLLPLPELLAKIQAENPGRRVMNATVFSAPGRAARVTFALENPNSQATNEGNAASAQGPPQAQPREQPGPRRRGEMRYVDPYTGELLGGKEIHGQEFLRTIEQVHRGMIAGVTGRTIVGISTITLVVLTLSGLYLRWPRSNALEWATWFKIQGRLKGRPFLWNLHAVLGTIVLPIYLLASLTGLYISFEWYRQGIVAMVGATPPSRDIPKLAQPIEGRMNVEKTWSVFERSAQSFERATLSFPISSDSAAEIRYLPPGAPHERAIDRIVIHPETGEIISHERYADKNAGTRLVVSNFPLHSGGYFGVVGKLLVMLASLAMPVFAVTGWLMYLKRRDQRRLAREQTAGAIADETAVGTG